MLSGEQMYREKCAMQDTYKQIGIPFFTKDHLAKVLAFLFVFGGGNEAVTHNPNLYSSIKLAQREANINGGEIPKIEYLVLLKQYAKECVKGTATWLEKDICERYGLPWKKEVYLVDLSKYFIEFRDKKVPQKSGMPDVAMLKILGII